MPAPCPSGSNRLAVARLVLSGIRASGRHGASPGERDAPQPFVIDLEVEVEAGPDDIEDTADYRDLVRVVRETVERGSFALLETLADAVARAVAAAPRVRRVEAVVRKPAAAERLGIGDVAARAIAGW